MALEGTLRDMPFADLFEVFYASRRSGRLLVSRAEQRGLMFVGAGQLLDAVLVTDLEGNHPTYAEDAAACILSWSEANFIFEHDPAVSKRPRRIMRDAAWFLASQSDASLPTPTLNSQLRPVITSRDRVEPVTLSAEEWRLLSALWTKRTLGLARAELGLEAEGVLSLAQSLIERGLLTLAEDKALSHARPQNQGYARPTTTIPPLGHMTHASPAAAPKSQLLQAIIRRVRTL